jgi:hypothetical protein
MTDIQADDLAGQVQAEQAPALLANRLTLAARWGGPCLGYLVIGRPPAAMVTALSAVQDQVQAVEPELLRQPPAALHSTVGFLIPVFRPVDHDKDEIWRQHGPGWLAGIGAAAAAQPGPLRLSFRHLVATDAAIIAVADAPNPLTGLRERLAAGLDLRWPLTKGPLVHVSLFRYRQPLRDPARLLDLLAGLDAAIDTEIGELLVVRETTFPLLEYEVMQRVPIGRPVR